MREKHRPGAHSVGGRRDGTDWSAEWRKKYGNQLVTGSYFRVVRMFGEYAGAGRHFHR